MLPPQCIHVIEYVSQNMLPPQCISVIKYLPPNVSSVIVICYLQMYIWGGKYVTSPSITYVCVTYVTSPNMLPPQM